MCYMGCAKNEIYYYSQADYKIISDYYYYKCLNINCQELLGVICILFVLCYCANNE